MNRDFLGTFFDPYYSGQLWRALSGTIREFGNYMTGNFVKLAGVLILTVAICGLYQVISKR